MKHTRRIASLLLALVMVFAMATTAFAATGTNNDTGKITIKDPIAGITYDAYQILKLESYDTEKGAYQYTATSAWASWLATQTSYVSIEDGTGYVTWVKDASAADFAAAAIAYAKEQEIAATKSATATADGAEITDLNLGYYLVDSSVGILCSLDTTAAEVEIREKNTAPTLDKKITGASSVDEDGKKALAQVGTNVEYAVDITVGTGAIGYVFHDVMDGTLSYNGDVKVYIGADEVDSSNYNTTTAAGDTITVTFNDAYIKTVAGQTLTVKYSAKVTSDALQTDPANNTAKLQYGDSPNVYYTPEKTTEVYNAKFTVTKKDGTGNPLGGAGFVLKNADGKYYKFTAATETTPATVTWVDAETDATEYFSDATTGVVPSFTGLANGTYTLVEKTVPSGYNKAEDKTFTIAEHNYSTDNLIQATDVINQSGSILPSTGGMGTTLFYVVGGLMVAAAVILLVTKKRMAAAE